MVRINWYEFKQEFLTGNFKSLKEFAKFKGITANGNFNKHTKGWTQEKAANEQQKGNKIVQLVQNEKIKTAVITTARFIDLWDKLINKVEIIIDQPGSLGTEKSIHLLEKLANTLEKVYKCYRLAEGLDAPAQDNGNLDALIKALEESR